MSKKLVKQYDEVEVVKQSFLSKLKGVDEQKINAVMQDGGWNLGQVYYHCYFSEYGTIKTIEKNLRENKVKQRSVLGDAWRNLLLLVILKSPFKFKAPAVVRNVPQQITSSEIENYFTTSSADFKKILENLPEEMEDKRIFKHPISGLFNIQQTLNFVKEHYRHHEMQINRLLKS